MPYKITAKMLDEFRLCDNKVKKFRRIYPHGLYITEKNILMVLKKRQFSLEDWYWLAEAFTNNRENLTLWKLRAHKDKTSFVEKLLRYWDRYITRLNKKKGASHGKVRTKN